MCVRRFPTKQKLDTHTTKFCDSAALKANSAAAAAAPSLPAAGSHPLGAAAGGGGGGGPASLISFDEVRQYLKDSDSSEPGADGSGGGGEYAAYPLAEVRRQFQAGEAERESMAGSVLKKLEQERLDELNQLKMKFNAAQAKRADDHAELARRMKEVESLRQKELNARLEKQRAKQVLDGLDDTRLDSLEQQKRKQIAHLLTDRENLQRKEKILADQLTKLEADLIREKEQRKREATAAALAAAAAKAGVTTATALDDPVSGSVSAAAAKVARANAQDFGERASELRLKKEALKRERDGVLQSLDVCVLVLASAPSVYSAPSYCYDVCWHDVM